MRRLRNKTDGILVFTDYKHISYRFFYVIIIAILILFSVITIFPLIWLILSSFKSAQELYKIPFTLFPELFTFGKVSEVWNYLDFTKYLLNSFIVILGAIICSVLFNGLLAYAISILKPKGHKIIFWMVMASLMIPPTTAIVPLFSSIVKLKLIDSYLPLWLVFGANPFYFLMFKTYFDGLPKTLFEAAEIDGANKWQMFSKVLLPLSKPIIMVVVIFTVNAAWSDFLLPYLVLQDNEMKTVMVKIYALMDSMGSMDGFGPDKLLMVLTFSIIPPILLFVIFQKQITTSVATSGLKE